MFSWIWSSLHANQQAQLFMAFKDSPTVYGVNDIIQIDSQRPDKFCGIN